MSMLCDKCGTPIPEESKICPNCGAEIAEKPAFSEADFTVGKKKKKKFMPLIIIGVILVVIAALVFVFWDSVSAMWIRNFGEPEEYFELVEKQALTDYAEEVSESYGRFLEGGTGTAGKMELTVSKTMLAMIPTGDLDLSWLDKLALEFESGTEDQATMAMMALSVAGQKVLDFSTIVDSESNTMYVGVPSLSDKYLTTTMGSVDSEAGAMITAPSFALPQLPKEAMPSEEVVNQLLNRYIDVLFEQIDDVQKSKETLTVGDVEQEVIVLRYEISEQDAMKIVEAILKEAKNDKDLEKVIRELYDYMVQQGMPEDEQDPYEAFKESIDEALADMAAYTDFSEEKLVWTIYVDDDEVIGRSISFDNEELLFVATATNGKDFATQLKITDALEVSGEGTISNGVREGDYALIAQGKELLNVELKLNEKKSTDGNMDVKLVIRPSAELLSQAEVDSQVASLFQSMDMGLEVKVLAQDQSAEMEVNVVSKAATFVGLKISAGPKDVDVKIPDESNCISVEDTENVAQWAKSLDFTKLAESLEKAGLPESWISAVESLAQAAAG